MLTFAVLLAWVYTRSSDGLSLAVALPILLLLSGWVCRNAAKTDRVRAVLTDT